MSQLNVTSLKHESASGDNITLSSNGNVGVGTSSPGTRLELGGDAVTILRMTSTSGPYAQVTANTVGTLQFMADEGNTGANTSMRFRVDGAEAMRIDSAGRVTMPYQPAFKARTLTSSSAMTTGVWTKVSFNTKIYDRGNVFNTSNNRFTAPVSGVYTFDTTVLFNGNNDNVSYGCAFAYNGTRDGSTEFRFYTSGVTATDGREIYNINTSASWSMTAGDYIEVYALCIGTNDQTLNGGSSFTGYLIG